MDNSKLIALLRTFNSTELREFRDFVASPFFNKNEELSLFFAALKKMAPKFPIKKIKRENIYKAVFPDQDYDEKHLNYLMSFLLKLGEQYIGYRKYQSQETLPEYHILASCIDRHLDKHYQNILHKANTKLQKSQLRNTNYYYQQYLISDIKDKFFQQQNIRKFDNNLQQAADNFDIYYLSNKLQYSIEMLDRQQYLSADYQQHLMLEVNQYISNNKLDHIPSIAIYYEILQTLLKDNPDEHFDQLKLLLQKYADRFTAYEMKQVYKSAINFCMRQIRGGKKKYQEELLELYLRGIKSKLLFESGHLSEWTYKNVVTLGRRMQRYEWTEEFILQNSKSLSNEVQQNALHYNLAELYYDRNNLDEALHHLKLVEFSDISYSLGVKRILLKIYFEKNEEEPLLSLLASFRIYLKRNKLISNDVRDTYYNFMSILTMIYKGDPKIKEEVDDKIKHTKLLTDRNWLLRMHQR